MEAATIFEIIFYILAFGVIFYFWKTNTEYKKGINYIVSNIVLTYKNFFHWNISKWIITLYSLVIGFILSSPLIGISIYLIFKLSEVVEIDATISLAATGDINPALISSFFENKFLFVLTFIVIILIFILFALCYIYSNFLQQNIYKNYIEGKKLFNSKLATYSSISYIIIFLVLIFTGNFIKQSFFFILLASIVIIALIILPVFLIGLLKSENHYFNYKLFWKYIKTMLWIFVYLLGPFLVLCIYLLTTQILSGFDATRSIVSGEGLIGGLIISIVSLAIIGYITYYALRLSFSYIDLLYNIDSSQNSKMHVLRSLHITKGNVLKMISLGVPFILIGVLIDSFLTFAEEYFPQFNEILGLLYFLFIYGMTYVIYISLYNILNNKETKLITKIVKKLSPKKLKTGKNILKKISL